MKKVIWSTAVMVFAAVLFCSDVKAQVFVNVQPVVPITMNTRPQPPASDYVWIDGHWLWHKPYNRYVWKDGYWASPPHARAIWVPGYWKTDVYCADDRGPRSRWIL